MQTDFVLNGLEQALYIRQPKRDGRLILHSDRGSQYIRIRYSERLWVAWFNKHRLCLSPSATYRRQRLRQTITSIWSIKPPR